MLKLSLTILLFTFAFEATAQTPNKTENIILITFDGLRWQELYTGADSLLISDKEFVKNPESLKELFWRNSGAERREVLMPFFWSTIAKNGQLYGFKDLGNKVNCTNKHWFSYPGYNEILCGFSDDERIDSNNKFDNPNVTVLEYLNNQPELKGSVAAFGSWDVFPFIINEQRSRIPVNAGFEENQGPGLSDKETFLNVLQTQIPSPWSTVRLDAFTHHYAMEYIKRNRPKITYIAYGETDDFAHEGHYDAYLKSARQTDAFIKDIWEFIQGDAQYKDKTTLIITTDHGRGTLPKENWKHHGSKIEGADEIWIAILGPDTPSLGVVKSQQQLYQSQVASTVAKFLGFDYTNEKAVGDIIASAFE